MKKMMLLASMVALAAMMLAAAPAFAQDGGDNKVTICHFPPGNPENAHTISVGEAAVPAHLAHGDFRGPCVFDRDFFDRDFFDRDFFDRDVVDVVPVISQDIEQEAESGDIDQSFDVSQTGDNSNQTVGIQGTANTGNAQNITNVVDAGNFGDFNNNNDGFVICDFDRDGRDDGDCEDFNHNNDGFVFCDRDRDGRDDGDDDCFVVFPDFNDGFFNDGFFDDGFFVNNGDDDIEIEDSGATIELSPTNTTNSHQEVNQAATAVGSTWWM
jgi:hypothetical protein